MKKSYLIAAVALVLVIGALAGKDPAPSNENATTEKSPTAVKLRPLKEFSTLEEEMSLPASIVGDQEIRIVAKTAGIAASASFELGSFVREGALLARIDDSAGNLSAGEDGFVNGQLQQTAVASEQARKGYDAAKKAYESLRKDPLATSAQLSAAKTQRDIAKLQLESAEIGLRSSLDAHLSVSPISGFVTKKAVSVGDSVAPGQLIATVSKTQAVKAQFYVDQEYLGAMSKGASVTISDNSGNDVPATIRFVSPAADSATRRFLIEAYPEAGSALLAGTVATVRRTITKQPEKEGAFILPLSALTVGQNDNYLFIEEGGRARKVGADILRVMGEYAEISVGISPESLLIAEGGSFLRDGDKVAAENN